MSSAVESPVSSVPSGSADRMVLGRTCILWDSAGSSWGSSSCVSWTQWSSSSGMSAAGSSWRIVRSNRCRCCCARPRGSTSKRRARCHRKVGSSRLPGDCKGAPMIVARCCRDVPANASTTLEATADSSATEIYWICRDVRSYFDATTASHFRYCRCWCYRCCTRRRRSCLRGSYPGDDSDAYADGGSSDRSVAWRAPCRWTFDLRIARLFRPDMMNAQLRSREIDARHRVPLPSSCVNSLSGYLRDVPSAVPRINVSV